MKQVSPANWESFAKQLVTQALPNDGYQLIDWHHANRSESLYATVLHDQALFQVRLAAHDHPGKTKSFVLGHYPTNRAMHAALVAFFKDDANALPLSEEVFCALALIERATQSQPLTYDGDWHAAFTLTAGAKQWLDLVYGHHLALRRHRDQAIVLARSGKAVLAHFDEVADDTYQLTPRLLLEEELVTRLSS